MSRMFLGRSLKAADESVSSIAEGVAEPEGDSKVKLLDKLSPLKSILGTREFEPHPGPPPSVIF